jgi:PAS domain-containing protein
MWNDSADAAMEGRTVWTVTGLLMALIAACCLWAWQSDPMQAAPYGVILVATALAAWFAARETARATRRLRTAEARLRAAAEALPDGLVVCDRHDRIVFWNSRYPQMMTEPLRRVLAIGKKFQDFLAEGVAAGPVYHPEMGEEFLKRRMVMRVENRSEHVHRIADGRWVRIRENRTPDGGRVLLTTDITGERNQAAQLRLLALAVEQAGDVVEITSGTDNGFTYVNHAF